MAEPRLFMPQTLTPSATQFIDSVLALKPEFAAFDCDGTLWSGDAGESFFSWEMERGLVSEEIIRWARARYADYRAGKVSEEDMCGEMVTMHRGMSEEEVLKAARKFFEEKFAGNIFPELRQLVGVLKAQSCDVWAVSSTNEWVIRAAMPYFGLPENRVLAAAVEVRKGTITDHLVRVPSGPGKPEAILEIVKRTPDAAFGNSRWDADMLKIARHPFAINPNPDLESVARQSGWRVYWPDSTQR
jgi:phosphoserine phosphatase